MGAEVWPNSKFTKQAENLFDVISECHQELEHLRVYFYSQAGGRNVPSDTPKRARLIVALRTVGIESMHRVSKSFNSGPSQHFLTKLFIAFAKIGAVDSNAATALIEFLVYCRQEKYKFRAPFDDLDDKIKYLKSILSFKDGEPQLFTTPPPTNVDADTLWKREAFNILDSPNWIGSRLWSQQNHSTSVVPIRDVSNENFYIIREHFRQLYPGIKLNQSDVQEIGTPGSSRNFQVHLPRPVHGYDKVLFRVESRQNDEEALDQLDAVVQTIASKRPEYKYLTPLPNSRIELDFPETRVRNRDSWSRVLPFFEHCYYEPSSIDDLRKLASHYGEFNSIIASVNQQDLTRVISNRVDLDVPPDLSDQWRALRGTADSSKFQLGHHARYATVRVSDHMIGELLDEVEPHLRHQSGIITYFDMHPHNVLCRKRGAPKGTPEYLICDLESCYPAPNPDISLSFAAHRMCREHVRFARRHLADAMSAFIESATAASGGLFNKDGNLDLRMAGGYIVAVNVTKALSVNRGFERGDSFESVKDFDQQMHEFNKLIIYAHEGLEIATAM